ncbi:peptidase domain-containing ABC transporter [Pedobacter sp. R20-19]|uniref:peptidase domain-containing ABC transporter n=1 Tax=Pedobacter sp. R20-19 TaxID=1270196 RepID=UPI000492EE5A|nr:peptidase domain-containing ABC transporter [Pedobacter sp. R20-19]
MSKKFKSYIQPEQMDCGPTCLKMICKHYGKNFSIKYLRDRSNVNREGASLKSISIGAESIEIKTMAVKIPIEKLHSVPMPCILHWSKNHFVVLYEIKQKKGKAIYRIADPKIGLIDHNEENFKTNWLHQESEGIALLLEPSEKFNDQVEVSNQKYTFYTLLNYTLKYKTLLIYLIAGLTLGSFLQLLFPYLTKSIVDVGIKNKDLNFIYIVVLAQFMLFIGRSSLQFIQSWILLHISIRVNISILSDFLIKLMRLPMSFFDTRIPGDILQRIRDHERIKNFFTVSSINLLFSTVSLIVFSALLCSYNLKIFLCFIISAIFYILYILYFLEKRRLFDFKRFDIESSNQGSVIQLVQGIQEIKLNNCEDEKRWEWEKIQAQLFTLNLKGLALDQTQQGGALFINEGKNILITCIAALAVIKGEMTLGTMLAIQYIIGQMNAPLDLFVNFMRTAQDAKISLERLNEIHENKEEEGESENLTIQMPIDKTISLKNVTFSYPGTDYPVLKDISLDIPHGKVTAIVGMSGSGKTTLLKLLLKFYDPDKGVISINNTTSLESLSHHAWRENCGVVMQDGFIFSDTIVKNITIKGEIDIDRLNQATRLANIYQFIDALPLKLETKIGSEGIDISKGEQQRILIARAIYKDPAYIILDEATNSLDANNEKVIIENLNNFFIGRTVIVVAHRLSTVKNADQIIVLEKGNIIESGSHQSLVRNKGSYYNLVKNQLELDN